MRVREAVIDFVQTKGEATRKEIIGHILVNVRKVIDQPTFDKIYSSCYIGFYSECFSSTCNNNGTPSFRYPSRKTGDKRHLVRVRPGVYKVTTAPPVPTDADVSYQYNSFLTRLM